MGEYGFFSVLSLCILLGVVSVMAASVKGCQYMQESYVAAQSACVKAGGSWIVLRDGNQCLRVNITLPPAGESAAP